LAFLIYLDELLLDGRIDTESILLVRHDFLIRHACRWPARASAAAAEHRIAPAYVCLLEVLAAAVDQDRTLTEAEIARNRKESA
jgi:hypothetical protein